MKCQPICHLCTWQAIIALAAQATNKKLTENQVYNSPMLYGKLISHISVSRFCKCFISLLFIQDLTTPLQQPCEQKPQPDTSSKITPEEKVSAPPSKPEDGQKEPVCITVFKAIKSIFAFILHWFRVAYKKLLASSVVILAAHVFVAVMWMCGVFKT